MNYTHENLDNSVDDPFIFTGVLASCFIFFFAAMNKVAGTPLDTTVPYESKYYDAFTELENDTLTDNDKKQLANSYVKELTDNDYVIIMSYSFQDESFHYWGENNIPFSTLDSAAQLYAIENKCKSICVDYRAEIDKASEKIEENKNYQKKIISEAPDSPFASFKKYNMTTSRAIKNTSIIPEKCNHFRRKGTVDEWILATGFGSKWINSINSDSSKTAIYSSSSVLQPMTYADWKSKVTINSI